jgi:FAD:protein FMN transferase
MAAATANRPSEVAEAFPCCGGRAAVLASGDGDLGTAVRATRRRLEAWQDRLTRFDPASELSRLNAATTTHVRVSDVTCLFVVAALDAARRTDGLVDATLVDEVEAAGYGGELGAPPPLTLSLAMAPPRAAARPSPRARWREVAVDTATRTVSRPAGVRLDSGGIAKGLFADLSGRALAGADSYAIDCCGDLRLGGRARLPRRVPVDDPFGGGPLHEFELAAAGVATSGIGRRSWLGGDGRPAHHLIDPATGRPAFTGVVQATALAPTAVEAEMRAKAALLAGRAGGHGWLRHGGVLVFDDGSHALVEPAETLTP